ncbi:zinc finger protein 493-like [Cimex lectularius]|uniref:Zinc finger protein n=1 Tax=Cimex lectularius TaxID=79782 RepID=A0A8I6TGD8_CIMLE|nr:zinc finger protein 493-like [Cimex lectularius]XP_014255326.1 zinc finger protein 493-like [Cimex lectularius]XP_024083170.1 zinc finger protein 493-like [Cimex lectularius]XP_024083171.1 zinc finger protein 493-like [Cimex lectularius]
MKKDKTVIKSYGDMCRLCGQSEKMFMTDIFDDKLELLENINLFIPIVIMRNDNLPNKICSVCCKSVRIATDLIKKAISTDEKLRKFSPINKPCESDCLPINGPIVCDICNTEFTNMVKFDNHMRKHKDVKIEQYENKQTIKICSDCGFAYRDEEKFLNHKDNCEKTCQTCKTVVTSSCTYFSHVCEMKAVPAVKLPIQQQNLKVAIPKLKTEIKTSRKKIGSQTYWQCEFCKKIVTTKVSLDIHMRTHTGAKPYICEHCGNNFRSRANLCQHLVIHTGYKKYSCPVCNKKFSRNSFVRTHMRVHTGERPYPCEVCGHRFSQIGDKRRHMIRHTRPADPEKYRKILPNGAIVDEKEITTELLLFDG